MFSRYQRSGGVVTATVVSLLVNLFFKVIAPGAIGLKLSRTTETLAGVGLPVLILLLFETYYRQRGQPVPTAERHLTPVHDQQQHREAERQNIFGISVIAVSSAIVGAGIILLGALAPVFGAIVITAGLIILLLAALIGGLAFRSAQQLIKDATRPS